MSDYKGKLVVHNIEGKKQMTKTTHTILFKYMHNLCIEKLKRHPRKKYR